MPKPRKPPATRKTDVARATIAGAAAKPVDPTQAGLFDAAVPGWMRPCLPTLVEKPPVGADWVRETKWDGYRVSSTLVAGKPIVRTRNGHDWTKRFPAIVEAVAALKARSAVIDGEAVILEARGASSFADLQADLDRHGSRRAVLVAFDLLFFDGEILWTKPFAERARGARWAHPGRLADRAERGLRGRRRRPVSRRLLSADLRRCTAKRGMRASRGL